MKAKPIEGVNALHSDMKRWMEYIHSHPEVSTKEHETARYIAKELVQMGYEVHEKIGKDGIYGVVGRLQNGEGHKSIGFRADMDAIRVQEDNNLSYKSRYDGISHLCGHDGHSAMALGGAKYLANTRRFNGTLHFIFQPSEENMKGGPAMIADGLFDLGRSSMRSYTAQRCAHFRGETMRQDNWNELTARFSRSMPEQVTVVGANSGRLGPCFSRPISWTMRSDHSAFLAGNGGKDSQ